MSPPDRRTLRARLCRGHLLHGYRPYALSLGAALLSHAACGEPAEDFARRPEIRRVDIYESTRSAEVSFNQFHAEGLYHVLVVLPQLITIEVGEFLGHEVDTRLIVQSGVPSLLGGRPRLVERVPQTVGVLRWRGTECIPTDSVMTYPIGQAIADINQLVGRPLFLLATPKNGRCSRDITVHIDVELNANELGMTSADHVRCVEGCGVQWIRQVQISLDKEADSGVAAHELLHAAGLGHTCLVPSIMATEFPGNDIWQCARHLGVTGYRTPLRLDREFSPYDVAALDLVARMAEALAGQRVDRITWVAVGVP